jgi:hypothetical protein
MNGFAEARETMRKEFDADGGGSTGGSLEFSYLCNIVPVIENHPIETLEDRMLLAQKIMNVVFRTK